MKNRKVVNILLLLFFSCQIFAQSDYRITQEFKSRHRSFEIAIEYAKTTDELNKIKKEIIDFKNEFRGNKELLNRALYPNNFESSFTNLDKKISYTNKKLSEIFTLQSKVTQVESDYAKLSNDLSRLTREVNSLRSTNSRLMSELKAFKSGYGGSRESIDSLKNLVSQLREGIGKRDTLIKEIMDNIFMTAEHKIESLNDAEKQSLKTKIKGTSLIDNIRNLISDNIQFLDASLFTPEDLSNLNSELIEFKDRWQHFGPKLFTIYSSDQQNRDKLSEIDTLISGWDYSLGNSIWRSINEVFKSHTIELDQFTSGEEFEVIITNFIDDEIKNASTAREVGKDQKFVYFSDRTWNEIIKPDWLPLLLASDKVSTDQILVIEEKIAEWKENVSGSKSYFIYAIIILLALIIIGSLIVIQNKKKKNKDTVNIVIDKEEQKKKDYEIGEEEEFVDDNN